jgi:hypothetical protein
MASAASNPTNSLFKGIKALLVALPSEEEKNQLIQTLSEAKGFIEELQSLVEAFPTIESSRGLSEGLTRLDILAERANNDAPLRKLMGLKSTNLSKDKNVNGSGDVTERARKLKETLNDSGVSNVSDSIARSGESIPVLTELATSLGLRMRNKERKRDLIERIATHIENQRGYQILRGGALDSTASAANVQP